MPETSDDKLDGIFRKAFDLEESGDIEESIRMFKLAARFGSNVARSNLGTIFDDVLRPAQPKKAVYWYKRGVKGGHHSCAWNLAMHYAGLGKRRGYLYWLRIAQSMGHSKADAELLTGYWWNKRNSG